MADPLLNIINQLSKLPGIGPKTAERLAYFLLDQPQGQLSALADALVNAKTKIITCSQCQNYSLTDPCRICGNSKRNQKIVCIVSKPQDITALEKTNEYLGQYYVLGGTVDPVEGITLEHLKIKKLKQRVQNNQIDEIILAFNPDLPGETTTLAFIKYIRNIQQKIKITRLARGLPMGSDLEYADEVTLRSALKGRNEIK